MSNPNWLANLISDAECLDPELLKQLETQYCPDAAWQIMRDVFACEQIGCSRTEAIEIAENVYISGFAGNGLAGSRGI